MCQNLQSQHYLDLGERTFKLGLASVLSPTHSKELPQGARPLGAPTGSSATRRSCHTQAGAGATHQLVKTRAQGRAPLIGPSQTHHAERLPPRIFGCNDGYMSHLQDALLPLSSVISGWSFEHLPGQWAVPINELLFVKQSTIKVTNQSCRASCSPESQFVVSLLACLLHICFFGVLASFECRWRP